MKWLCVASLALVLMLTASAPAAAPAVDAPKTCPYYPMRDGTTWTYKSGDSKFTVQVTKHETVQTYNSPGSRRSKTVRPSLPRTYS